MKRVLTICVALLLVMVVGTVPVAAAVEAPTCWTVAVQNEGRYDNVLEWIYEHKVAWCGNGTAVVSVAEPAVWVDLKTSHCSWHGTTEARSGPPGGWSAETFSVGPVVCTTDDAITRGMNPWAILTVYGNGEYDIEKGIA